MEGRIERMASASIESPRETDAVDIGKMHLQAWKETYRDDENGITEEVIDEMMGFLDSPEGAAFRANTFAQAEQNPDSVLYKVVRKDGKVVGFLHGSKQEGRNLLEAIYLLNEMKGTGLGDSLMQKFLAWADKDKPSLLEVMEQNSRARSFYEKYGFRRLDGKVELYKDRIPFVEMERPAENGGSGAALEPENTQA